MNSFENGWGLPTTNVLDWFSGSTFPKICEKPPYIHKEKKNIEIPTLHDYSKAPGRDFWAKFPFRV